MSFIKWQEIIEQTNNGLDIILFYYPDARQGLDRKDKKFKIRDEKTASASIRFHNGEYKVTDFGGDQKERNAIGVCMLETNKTFAEACQYLAAQFHITGSDSSWSPIKPEFERRPIKKDENKGEYNIETKDFTEAELKTLGPAVEVGHCLDYQLFSVKSFSYVKDTEVLITTATENYPIYAFIGEGWAKLYQPFSYEKQYRFRFLGQKPERFVYGMALLKSQFQKNKARIEEELQNEELKNVDTDPRVENVFICSGGSDGLNIRSFGHTAIWFNSESEQISYEEYRLIKTWAKNLIYVPDLDHTGMRASVDLGLKYLDIKLMILPSYLKNFRDRRGNPCKDFKDFVEKMYDNRKPRKFTYMLDKLIENALPCEFWDSQFKGDRTVYYVRWTQLFNFLRLQGFGRHKDEQTKDGFQYVRVDGNIIRVVRPHEIEGFVNNFLKERQMPVELRDKIYTTNLSDRALTKLDTFDIDFNIADRNVQYMFFSNQVWEITAEGITHKRVGEIDRYVWDRKVLEHTVHVQDNHFKITRDVHDDWDISILKKDNKFFNYLINTSRIHWRKDLEYAFEGKKVADKEAYFKANQFNIAGSNLNENEILEQKLHLINKIYALGYMLHTYKSPQRPWAVYAMDNKVAVISESHGGSGKSVFMKSIQQILKVNHYINGRDSKKTQDDFIYHGINDETDYTLVDDCHQYLDYGFFYNAITGDLDVNNKQGMRYIIPFDKSPKIGFASNFPPNNMDPSLERRLLFIVFSDYYHYNKDGEYEQTRTISDDFENKTLFKDFTENDWNDFLNFCGQAISFYLSQNEKIDPPMGNVTKRNLLNEMGEAFKNWADVFFAVVDDQPCINLDSYVPKMEAQKDYAEVSGYKKVTSQRFKKSLKAYCRLHGWNYNPEGAGVDSGGRIMHNLGGTTTEMFYIQTQEKINSNTSSSDDNDFFNPEADELSDDL